jgi:hypothetical protein
MVRVTLGLDLLIAPVVKVHWPFASVVALAVPLKPPLP